MIFCTYYIWNITHKEQLKHMFFLNMYTFQILLYDLDKINIVKNMKK